MNRRLEELNSRLQIRSREIDFHDPRGLPEAEVQFRGQLPHIYKQSASYFVTFRLWDAIVPAEQRRRVTDLRKVIGKSRYRKRPEYAIELAKQSEPLLTSGSCLLRDPVAAQIVADAVRYFDQERYQLAAWCVMPNHVHTAYTALHDWLPQALHHSWKSFSANKINKRLGRKEPLWQLETFDHMIRSVEHYVAFMEYIERNPVEAGFCEEPEEWRFSSAWRGL